MKAGKARKSESRALSGRRCFGIVLGFGQCGSKPADHVSPPPAPCSNSANISDLSDKMPCSRPPLPPPWTPCMQSSSPPRRAQPLLPSPVCTPCFLLARISCPLSDSLRCRQDPSPDPALPPPASAFVPRYLLPDNPVSTLCAQYSTPYPFHVLSCLFLSWGGRMCMEKRHLQDRASKRLLRCCSSYMASRGYPWFVEGCWDVFVGLFFLISCDDTVKKKKHQSHWSTFLDGLYTYL
jgi:hypothetical protein